MSEVHLSGVGLHLLNAAGDGASLGRSAKTADRYLDLLAGTCLVRVLPPRFENVGKRLVKSPKAHLRDSGILHFLLGLETSRDLAPGDRECPTVDGITALPLSGVGDIESAPAA